MSRSIYNKRQLQVYQNVWTVRDRILAGVVLIVLMVCIAMLVNWILSSEHPILFSIVGVLACVATYTAARYGTGKDDWPTYMAIWVFFGSD